MVYHRRRSRIWSCWSMREPSRVDAKRECTIRRNGPIGCGNPRRRPNGMDMPPGRAQSSQAHTAEQ